MTETPIEGGLSPDLLLTDRTEPPGGWRNPRSGFLAFLAIGTITAAMALLVPGVLTLSLKSQIIDPAHPANLLSLAQAVAGIAQLLAFPLLGRFSDRTLLGFGRRRPFLLLGAVLIAIGTLGLLAAQSAPLLVVANVVLAVGYSAVAVSAVSVIADQLAPQRRGPASAVVGLSLPVGALIGLFIAQLVAPNLALMILLPGALGVIGVIVFAVLLKDRTITRAERPSFSPRAVFETYWVNPAKSPSFALAWWSRLLIFFGVSAIQAYQVFYLIAILHFTPASVANAVFLSTLVLTVTALVFSAIAAKLSDVVGRRKPFVIAAALVFGVGLVLAANAHSFGAFLLAIGVIGVGQGVYLAVDIALVTQVVPDPNNPAKDLGIMNLASTLPQALVPAMAPALLAIGASVAVPQNYPALFIAGAIAGIIGALLIVPIRKVR
jgi:MFS family permease